MVTRETDPAIGWFVLSEADRAAAARYLNTFASDGTRDELGFGPIHFAYADRFFPGTSVQHERLRYIFFVAWTYEELHQATAGESFPLEMMTDIEERYSRRLMNTVPALPNSGISGWMKYLASQTPVVPASRIYWSALKTWQILNSLGPIDEPPNQRDLHRSWPRLASYDEGGDGSTVSLTSLFDDQLPKAPSNWRHKRGRLPFQLTKDEAAYIRLKWQSVRSEPPLLSKLAETGTAPESLWSREIARVASPSEQTALARARGAASLVCIARAAYAALVEQRRNRDLDRSDRLHAEALPDLIDAHRSQALRLDVDDLARDALLDRELHEFLKRVQTWTKTEGALAEIEATVAQREYNLKDERAYLSNEKRRSDWSKGTAEPLDYRWPKVRILITDVIEVV